ncbi:MAG: type II toxin-antitoxin system YafQ family toxin, partial [Muribaculaceae bacterium]|nr:type II toxin-antitoxin system YafQ family toxin [Muribaculaceae bacterium]
MKEVKSGKQFKKDLKKFANQPKKLMELYSFINNYLRTGLTIPEKYRPHMLQGN